ncbi:MAG TPA: protein kinase, partial [Egibacteraceae bacterium]|nr:protein kinase [Egibacteraceae bacterium]
MEPGSPRTESLRDVLAGRYRLDARVGAGGMATIYRARDLTLDRDVAVKVLHPHLMDDDGLRERFRTEARHAARLLHPNIVNVFDTGDREDPDGLPAGSPANLPWIVMEYVDGPSLRDVLRERERLSPREALSITEPVARALARAHGGGVVHRDIKPENVLIAADGTPKVADFGIARALAETSHTQTGTLIGSVHYMAPELVSGKPATAATDQYGLGVLLYELLTGTQPLPAESPMAIALRHAQEAIPPPSAVNPEVPAALDAVVARATAHAAEDRFPDMESFAAALRAAVPDGPEPVVVHRPVRHGGAQRGGEGLH